MILTNVCVYVFIVYFIYIYIHVERAYYSFICTCKFDKQINQILTITGIEL